MLTPPHCFPLVPSFCPCAKVVQLEASAVCWPLGWQLLCLGHGINPILRDQRWETWDYLVQNVIRLSIIMSLYFFISPHFFCVWVCASTCLLNSKCTPLWIHNVLFSLSVLKMAGGSRIKSRKLWIYRPKAHRSCRQNLIGAINYCIFKTSAHSKINAKPCNIHGAVDILLDNFRTSTPNIAKWCRPKQLPWQNLSVDLKRR